jgi:hypothetical protein
MDKERMNQEIRNSEQLVVAMTKLDPEIYSATERVFDGMKAVSGSDFLKAFQTAADLLMSKVGDLTRYAVAMETSIAQTVVLSLLLVPKPQTVIPLFDSQSITSEETKKLIQSHVDAKRVHEVTQGRENIVPTFEAFRTELSTCADQETVKRLLFHSNSNETPVEISTGQILPVIKKPPKELSSASIHRIRATVHSCDIEEQVAKVTIVWAEDPSAAALNDLFERRLKLTFDTIVAPQVGKLLQLASASDVNLEMNVTVTRALEKFDQKLDRLRVGELIRVRETEQAIRRRLAEIQAAYLLADEPPPDQAPLM